MSSLRERRLLHDFSALKDLAEESAGRLQLEKAAGDPPEHYILKMRCCSVSNLLNGAPVLSREQRIRLHLPVQYPAVPPQAVMLSPIFHPHVWPNQTVCLGHWSPPEKLDTLVLRIASILIFDPAQFNWKSVANHEAAVWAQKNLNLFPLDNLWTTSATAETKNLISWQEAHG